MQAEAAALRITLPGDAEAALELLAWAFLGRVVALPSPSVAGRMTGVEGRNGSRRENGLDLYYCS